MLAALVISDQSEPVEDKQPASRVGSGEVPWASLELLGQIPVAAIAQNLKAVCDSVSVIATGTSRAFATTSDQVTGDFAADCLANYRQEGFDAVLIARCGAYVELDAADMYAFHQEQGCGVTRAFADANGEPLDVWMVDPSALREQMPLLSALCSVQSEMYRSQGYVNRLQGPRDYRRLVLDVFHARCRLRPQGTEINPGIWIGEGAQVERSARIVAPALIGRNVRISDECLITRGSNIESDSHIDFGTAVEESSILSNSYVGVGLDLTHSIVNGRNLLNLQHNVNLEITDPVVMRENTPAGRDHQSWVGVGSSQFSLLSAG